MLEKHNEIKVKCCTSEVCAGNILYIYDLWRDVKSKFRME